MFLNVSEELKKARIGKYAIGAFNTSNLEITKAICSAAKEAEMPIIIQTTPSSIEYAGLEQIISIVKTEIEISGIDASLHLDHAKDFETVKRCIDAGYRSVMIDGSKLPFEENVALTKKVVDYAHSKNVSVEGEIGAIATEEGGEIEGKSEYSSVEETRKFVDLTGVDSVAVSVGNQHGAPEGEKINLALLKEITESIEIPVVMHGCSGLSESDIKSAVDLGVSKFNIDTQIRIAFSKTINGEYSEDYRKMMVRAIDSVQKVVERYIKLFSNK